MVQFLTTFSSRLLNGALDQVLPPRCGVCGATGSFLCSRCEATLPHAEPPRLAPHRAAAVALPTRDDLVKRRRWTAPQARIQDHAERHNNVLGAFAPGKARFPGARVLLVDDVTTTGATFGACASALQD